ncbi:MAG: calcium-binding protein, partial [Candidatus Hinthialibacter sp.]
TYGHDYIAGGADDDMIFGQLGDDVIQGDGAIQEQKISDRVSISIELGEGDKAEILYFNVDENISDGDDYIEGA